MNDVLNEIDFKFEQKDVLNDNVFYKITMKIPMKIGWIDDMLFTVLIDEKEKSYKINHVKNVDGFVFFSAFISLPTRALYNCYFSFNVNGNYVKSDMYKLSVNFSVPDWVKGKIMYHIFVDRFNRRGSTLKPMDGRVIHSSWNEDIIVSKDSNNRWNTDFYGGNIRGIVEKLDYLKSLGVSIIYLSPIFLSQSNHRYDVADYTKVDPYVGKNKDLKYLCDRAHSKDIKVIIDAVFNHTGNDSKYFNEYGNFDSIGAFESKYSKYYSFYRINDRGEFDYWWGMKNLPVCDGNSKEWQDYIYGEGGIIDLWFSYGIDGLRIDVADELTDGFIEGIRKAVKRNKEDGFILGEVWENPMHMNRDYLISGKGMDSVMNYQLVDALIRYYKYSDCNTLKRVIGEILSEYPTDTINTLMNFTSTHDITRAINIFGTDEFKKKKWAWDVKNEDRDYQKDYVMTDYQYELGKKIYFSYVYALTFFPGILSIFYGDEIGMQGLGNLANRRPFTWNNIDEEILCFFKAIGEIRKNEVFLETADLELLSLNEEYFVFKRYNDCEEMLIFISRSNYDIHVVIPYDYENEDVLYELNGSSKKILRPYGGLVLKKTLK